MYKLKPMAVAIFSAIPALAAAQAGAPQAGSAKAEVPAVVVTGNPLGSGLFEQVPPVSVLEGQGLMLRRRATLGDTLEGLPGVGSTGYGPAVGRPVIRGLDADRIRILQNGGGTLDASSLSFDHAVAIDPVIADRIEVVRGPAALLYGGSAVGGVVNVIDNRIPLEPLEGVKGRAEFRFGGAGREEGGSVAVEAGTGRLVMHADAHMRKADDLSIKGPAVSSRLRALANAGQRTVQAPSLNANGTLPNSASRTMGGGLGGSVLWDRGQAGLSYSEFRSDYGAVAEPGVVVDMDSNRWDLSGELRDLGLISAVKLRHGRTDYVHREISNGTVGTTFINKGGETRVEAIHGKLGPLTGSFGVQLNKSDFSALGAEAFVPTTNTDGKALFIFEEMTVGRLKLNFGARTERTSIASAGGGAVPTGGAAPRFGVAQTRRFDASSTAGGLLYTLTPGVALAANLSSTQRAPTATELFANGPHAATGAYEVGNVAFDKERSRSLDAALRLRSGPHSGSIGVFHTRFRNFITEFRTGATRGADGEVAPVDAGDGTSVASGEEIFPEVAFQQVPAVFRGIEAEGRFRLSERKGQLDLELRLDTVRARNSATGTSLPRIAPTRFGTALVHSMGALTSRVEVVRAKAQNQVAANEIPTDAYTLLNASATWQFRSMAADWELFVRGQNLLNAEARNHVSFIKDIAPMAGRSIMAGVRSRF